MEAIILETFGSHDNPFEKWRCLFNKDPFEGKDWLRITTSNIGQLFQLLCCGLILSTSILLVEIFSFKKHFESKNPL